MIVLVKSKIDEDMKNDTFAKIVIKPNKKIVYLLVMLAISKKPIWNNNCLSKMETTSGQTLI